MKWVVRISNDAQTFIDSLAGKVRRQVTHSISQLEDDPFHGNVKPLHGKAWRGWYRKRTGDYRVIFSVNHELHTVDIASVLPRSEKTYR